jgi:hypothetical protein
VPYPVQRLHAVLKSGGLPDDAKAVQKLTDGLEQIAGAWPRWFVEQYRLTDTEIAEALKEIIKDANRLGARFGADADPQRQIESILSGHSSMWPLDLDKLREYLRNLAQWADFNIPFYSRGWRGRPSATEPTDWLFVRLYELAAEIGEAPPGRGTRFYRFVKGCAELLAIELPNLEEAAFIKRLKRALLDERWLRAMG